MMRLTIFTPTFNRKETLSRLYVSLCEQIDKDFLWLIVDDGSNDNTESIVKRWIKEGLINIKYVYQNNMGKPAAHNLGVKLTETELFVCVDSDDYLTRDAISTINKENIKDKEVIGVVYKRGFTNMQPNTTWSEGFEYSTLKNAYDAHRLKGDTMLVYKTEILKKFKFPMFNGEKFVPEAYLYDQLDKEGYLKFVDKVLYLGDYLNDGYTVNMKRVIAKNPNGYFVYIEQRIGIDRSLKNIILDTIRSIAIRLVLNKSIFKETRHPFISFMCYLPGLFLYYRDYRKYVNWRKA